jgi:hypothetical protein
MSTIDITEKLLTLDPDAPDYRQERMKLMVAYLKDYMNTYDKQPFYENYRDETLISDVLYGLGVAIDPSTYQFADGFGRWKEALKTRHLT